MNIYDLGHIGRFSNRITVPLNLAVYIEVPDYVKSKLNLM